MSCTPLAGILVVDLSHALAGPHATMILGDLGARVIKVEPPTGDHSREWGPPFVGQEGAQESTYFLSCNRSKESVTADLKTPEGRSLLDALVARADVLVENFRPGVLDRLGFSIDRLHQLNPRLVVLSISGFGHDGPEGGRAGYDQIAQGEAGLMSLTGPSPEQPTKVGVPVGDLTAGIHGALGVVAALHERHSTGRGCVVRTSLLASLVSLHAYQGTRFTVAGEVPQAAGNHHAAIAPYGLFRCRGGSIQLAVANDHQWRALCTALHLDADDQRFASNRLRVANRDALIAAIEATLAQDDAETWKTKLAGIPVGIVRTLDEVYTDPQALSQGLLAEVQHSTLGTVHLPGNPLRFDDQTRISYTAPPTLGEHNAAVRHWLG